MWTEREREGSSGFLSSSTAPPFLLILLLRLGSGRHILPNVAIQLKRGDLLLPAVLLTINKNTIAKT